MVTCRWKKYVILFYLIFFPTSNTLCRVWMVSESTTIGSMNIVTTIIRMQRLTNMFVNNQPRGGVWQIQYNHSFTIHIYYQQRGTLFSRFSSNSKTNASELLENLEEMFPQYYMHGDMFSTFKSSTFKERVRYI